MKNIKLLLVAAALLASFASSLKAQDNAGDIYWRIDRSVKSCSMVLDPSLTQSQWKTFVEQVGAIASFKPLASAKPLGPMNFSVGIDNSHTPVDQRNLAWINTFVHPDEDCPLGDAISIPTIRARMGISDKMDIGLFWTHAPNANYGLAGGELKYMFSDEMENLPAFAVRGSAAILTGVSDFDFQVYGVEVMASKDIAMFTPFVGFRGCVAVGTETTSKVNLDQERIPLTQLYAGLSYSFWVLNLAAEYDVANVNTFAMTAGFKF